MQKATVARPASRPAWLIDSADFWRLWFVGLVVFVVRWVETVAVGVFVYQHTGSAFIVAMMTMLRLLPRWACSAPSSARSPMKAPDEVRRQQPQHGHHGDDEGGASVRIDNTPTATVSTQRTTRTTSPTNQRRQKSALSISGAGRLAGLATVAFCTEGRSAPFRRRSCRRRRGVGGGDGAVPDRAHQPRPLDKRGPRQAMLPHPWFVPTRVRREMNARFGSKLGTIRP